MIDKKLIATITRRLDRIIGMLDNCCDTGEMSDSTRARMVEMLHTAISEIYAINKKEEYTDEINVERNAPIIESAPTVEMFNVSPVIEEQEEIVVKYTNVETTYNEEESDEAAIANREDTKVETIVEQHDEKPIDETPEVIAGVIAVVEPVYEEKVENIVEQIEEVPYEEKGVTEKIESEKVSLQYDNNAYDTLIELETPTLVDYFVAETVRETKAAEEEKIVENKQTETIVEQPVSPIQPAQPLFDVEEELRLAKERAQIQDLRYQLEQERNRLEEELQSWQRERLKREEEMKAAEQLLATLEAETQKRKMMQQAAEQSIGSPEPVAAPVVVPSPVTVTVVSTPVNNITKASDDGKEVINIINSTTAKTTLADKFSENRQFLHNSFEMESLKMQGITPIPDLTKAIGINDKFQFIKELFGGDSDKYVDTIRTLNSMDSLQDALQYIETRFSWDKNNDAAKRILLLIHRRYMQ